MTTANTLPPPGVIIAASIIVAAGIALYESPQVREFVEKSRRKIALELHGLGDRINPPQARRTSSGEYEAEDLDPEIIRRRHREYIIERNRRSLELKRAENSAQGDDRMLKSFDFDAFLNEDHASPGTFTAFNSATEHGRDAGLRKRQGGIRGLDRGSVFASPFEDDLDHTQVLFDANLIGTEQDIESKLHLSRESTATLAGPSLSHESDEEMARRLQAVFDQEAISSGEAPVGAIQTHIDEPVSAPIVSAEATPSSDIARSRDLQLDTPFQPSSYWSVHEWANSTDPHGPLEHGSAVSAAGDPFVDAQSQASSILTPKDGMTPTSSAAPSVVGNADDIAREMAAEADDMDVMSEAGVSTVGSWSDVGSQISENHII
jgi:hypothetical protein